MQVIFQTRAPFLSLVLMNHVNMIIMTCAVFCVRLKSSVCLHDFMFVQKHKKCSCE